MLPFINYSQTDAGSLALEIGGCSAASLVDQFGTPLYVYSADAISANYRAVEKAFAPVHPQICYALKASGNLHILRLLADCGAGMDVVSGGELERAWLSGVNMQRIVFAGVGKTKAEIAAALSGRRSLLGPDAVGRYGLPASERGCVGLFNIESPQEADRIASLAAEVGVRPRACLRVNPDVDAHTHRYTTTGKQENKFGVDIRQAREILLAWKGHPHLNFRGVHIHLGSPISSPAPYVEAVGVVHELLGLIDPVDSSPPVLNIGGGFGADYGVGDEPASIEEFGVALLPLLTPLVRSGVQIIIEPGRCIVARAGVLLTSIQYVKLGRAKRFVICDAGMHTLLRPALYEAFHAVWPIQASPQHAPRSLRELAARSLQAGDGLVATDVVGPVCESSDFLATGRWLPSAGSAGMAPGDALAIFCAGAYGMSMTSTYNDHPRPAEVLVQGGHATLIRPRQTNLELLTPELGLHAPSAAKPDLPAPH